MNTDWDYNLKLLVSQNGYGEDLYKILMNSTDCLLKNNLQGFCHAMSSILFVVLNERGFNPILNIGEIQIYENYADHSWITLDNKIIDLAIYLPMPGCESLSKSPVILGKELITKENPKTKYGCISGMDFSLDTKAVLNYDFCSYMNAYPIFKDGLWHYVKQILGFEIDISKMCNKYKNTKRNVIH